MATNPVTSAEQGLALLELLNFAGWQLQIRQGPLTRIRATRGDVQLDVTGSSLSEAAGRTFARAMRSSSGTNRREVK